MHRAVEIDRPERRAGGGRRGVADDECRMRQIELQIERVARAGAHLERRVELEVHRHRQVARRALRMLNLNLIGRHAGAISVL